MLTSQPPAEAESQPASMSASLPEKLVPFSKVAAAANPLLRYIANCLQDERAPSTDVLRALADHMLASLGDETISQRHMRETLKRLGWSSE